MSEIVFYTNPMSRGRIVRWMLEEIEVPYRTEVLDYGPAMKAEPYLAINPMGKVPAITHGDTVVTESAAICAYLADAFPDAGLAPPPAQRGDYYRWLFFTAGCVDPALTQVMIGLDIPDGKDMMVGYGNPPLVVDVLDSLLQATAYVAGPSFSAADLMLSSSLGWGMEMGTIEKRPSFSAYVERCYGRPAARRATEIDDALLPAEPAMPA